MLEFQAGQMLLPGLILLDLTPLSVETRPNADL
jgi:hypothetical protein